MIVYPSTDGGFADVFAAPGLRARLEAVGELWIADDLPDRDELVRRVSDSDALLLTTHLPTRRCGPRGCSRLVAFTGTGAASYVSVPLARELGIAVTNVTH